MSGASDMKLRYGEPLKAKSIIYRGLSVLMLMGVSAQAQASFCRCVPQDWEDFRIFVAPQLERVKLTLEDFAIYRGVLKGGSFGFEYKPFCDFYCGVFAEWMMGDCNSAQEMSRYLHDIDGQVRLGYNFPMWNLYKLTFTPFLGLGYEQIIHHIRPDLVLTSEKFRYEHYYFPFGLLVDLRVTHHFGLGVVAERTISISQRLKTPYIQGVKFQLSNKDGYLIEFPFHLYFGSQQAKAQISLIPYLKRVVDGKLYAALPDGATLTLPEQTYTFWGLRLALGAAF